MWTVAIFGVMPAIILAGILFAPPITQDTAYHNFADQRFLFGIPSFWKCRFQRGVPFAATFGAWVLRSRWSHLDDWERAAFATLVLGPRGAAIRKIGSEREI